LKNAQLAKRKIPVIQTESSLALQLRNAMTTAIRSMLTQSVQRAKDALSGTLAMAKRLMAASEKSIARREAMMFSATSSSIAVMTNAQKRRRTTAMTEADKWIAHQSESAISSATACAQLVKGAVYSRLR